MKRVAYCDNYLTYSIGLDDERRRRRLRLALEDPATGVDNRGKQGRAESGCN